MVIDAADLVLVALAKLAPHHLVAPPALFFSASWASWASTTSPSNAPSSLSRVDAVERKPCAQWSPPGPVRSPCPQRLCSVCCRTLARHRHWTSSRSRISVARSALRRRSRAKRNRVDPRNNGWGTHDKTLPWPRDIMLGRSRPDSTQSRVRFRSGRLWRPERHGACLLPWSLLFYFCQLLPRVILLVFPLVSAAIDDKNYFKFKWL